MKMRIIALFVAGALALGVTQASAGEIDIVLGVTGPDRGRACVERFLGDGFLISANCSGRVFPHARPCCILRVRE